MYLLLSNIKSALLEMDSMLLAVETIFVSVSVSELLDSVLFDVSEEKLELDKYFFTTSKRKNLAEYQYNLILFCGYCRVKQLKWDCHQSHLKL